MIWDRKAVELFDALQTATELSERVSEVVYGGRKFHILPPSTVDPYWHVTGDSDDAIAEGPHFDTKAEALAWVETRKKELDALHHA